MALCQAQGNTRKVGRQRSVPKNEARPQDIKKERPQDIKKERPQLSSPKGKDLQLFQERTASKDWNTEPKHSLPSLPSNIPNEEAFKFPQNKYRKQKRSQENEPTFPSSATPSQKRPRTSPPQSPIEEEINPLEYWRRELRWPKEYFEPEITMNPLLARKKSSLFFRGKQSEAGSAAPSSITPSDQKPREAKSIPYVRASYAKVLATKGSFMSKSDLGITDASKSFCQTLLEKVQTVPQDSLFGDDVFDKACRKIQNRNEAMVVRDISSLIVPPAQTLSTYGATHLDHLIESVNEGWNSSIPFYGPRPQPDYSVGFEQSAFTENQFEKLKPFVGEIPDTCTSYFMATWQIYFPFLTCEVKCGAAALDIADRQNAHSMTMAVRGVVELFRLVKREKELHREILAFSVSHDYRTVRIYGHYPVIDGKKTTFYRYPIRAFDLTSEDGKEKWTAYKFTKNVYDIWMPTHLKRICSVIDELPIDLDFEVSKQSEPESELSQGLESHQLSNQSSHGVAFMLEEADNQSSRVGDVTPDTSISQRIEGEAFKRPRKRGRPAKLHQ